MSESNAQCRLSLVRCGVRPSAGSLAKYAVGEIRPIGIGRVSASKRAGRGSGAGGRAIGRNLMAARCLATI